MGNCGHGSRSAIGSEEAGILRRLAADRALPAQALRVAVVALTSPLPITMAEVGRTLGFVAGEKTTGTPDRRPRLYEAVRTLVERGALVRTGRRHAGMLDLPEKVGVGGIQMCE
ncbi:hypothetical protein D3877_29150 [Azospirillum cavernae]|uniref:Uncharacterized protein n=1 Tax=Azospirillum cavernae TaxID=2320860 RepID=A0A418VJX9_9PROT|nr:hypothetical protein D3877_29150 [Azospirillum cavernae]